MRKSKLRASWMSGAVVVLLAALSACGGGGGDDSPAPGGGEPPAGTLPPCPTAANPLRDITAVQGPGRLSPFDGQAVTVRGVVTADFQGDNQLKGFFIQQPVPDADPKTSEGLFVFAPGGADVKVGDYVQASGTVSEFKSGTTDPERLTELATVTEVSVCGAGPAIAARQITLPLADPAELEAVEGMLVEFKQTLTVSEVHDLGR